MKTQNKLSLICTLFLGAFLLFACSSDDKSGSDVSNDTALEDFSQHYFHIPGSDFTDKNRPATNSTDLKILSITGNSTVLAGGSNSISVEASDNATAIIVGIEGQRGYFTFPMNTDHSSSTYSTYANNVSILLLLLGQELEEDITLYFAATDGQGNYGAYENLDITYMSAGSGALQVSLSWDQENDVDLHLIEPNGEKIYFGHAMSMNYGELDVDSNPACNIDNINNENIFYDEELSIIEAGEYEVLVDLWSNCNIEDDTSYTIVAYYNGVLLPTSEGSNPHTGILSEEDESHNTNPISVMKFEIPDGDTGRPAGSIENSQAPKAFQFNFKKKNENKVLSPQKL